MTPLAQKGADNGRQESEKRQQAEETVGSQKRAEEEITSALTRSDRARGGCATTARAASSSRGHCAAEHSTQIHQRQAMF